MSIAYDSLMRILDAETPPDQRLVAVRGFAEALDWTPSYEFRGSFGVLNVEDHLVVEHGIENSAIISFIRAPTRAVDLDNTQLKNLLSLSYNNLVEWHLFVSETEVLYINNLIENSEITHPITRKNLNEYLSGQKFEQVTQTTSGKRSILPCDDLFIQIISRWKRLIKADYRGVIENDHLSSLFNSIILVRACEDHRTIQTGANGRSLFNVLEKYETQEVDLGQIICDALREVGIDKSLESFVDIEKISRFKSFDKATASDMFRDFYRPSGAEYGFNFSLMSKHALSRIYERYVALLDFDEEDERQLSFINAVPTERVSRKTGSVYTPLFIAGFFARYLRENLTPRAFRSLRSIDPACGSGIFLRTLLELQCNPLVPGTTPQSMKNAFESVLGIDRDPNACEATSLSLTLLYLVAQGKLPKSVNVKCADAIRLALDKKFDGKSFGAVLANPPYVKLDHLSQEERKIYSEFLKNENLGRIDSYVAFVKLCLDLVESGGFVCLVLPQVFLVAKNSAFLRKKIVEEFYVRCLVDLTAIPIFEGVGAYNILLIVQKRMPVFDPPPAIIARVQEFVGPALQACLDGRYIQTPYYNVFGIGQSFFREDEWVLLNPLEIKLRNKFLNFSALSKYLDVRQGFLSGADDVFIVNKDFINKEERKIFVDYLPDKSISRYSLPSRVEQIVFYPYERGKAINEEDLRTRYPTVWRYLCNNKERLKERKSVLSGDTPWWRPVRSREPKNILRPKIVCPHLMLTPRFAIDVKGSFAVSHSPFIIAREDKEELTILKFFCAVLNSSVGHWYITTHAPKYSRGYNRVEVFLMKKIPVPDPARVPSAIFRRLIELVERNMKNGDSREVREVDDKIDTIVCDLYELNLMERELLTGKSA